MKMSATPVSSSLEQLDPTVPQMTSDRLRAKSAPLPVSHSANRKTERLERRELLYSVVRDSMTRTGVLAASYKFKVLSLDARGLQYLIMMDLLNQSASAAAGRLTEVEGMIAQTAKLQHDILVTAVYWRLNDQVIASPVVASAPVAELIPERVSAHAPLMMPPLAAQQPTASQSGGRYEPLLDDEMVAFQRALASSSTAPGVPLSPSGRIVEPVRRHPVPPLEFENTQILDSNERASPLSGTQFGSLN